MKFPKKKAKNDAPVSKDQPFEDVSTVTEMFHAATSIGWKCIPNTGSSKKAYPKGYMKVDYDTEEHFESAHGIAIRLGVEPSFLHDVDLDDPSTLSFAPHFLPETGFVFGHKNKEKSHYFYSVENGFPNRVWRFKPSPDSEAEVLLELRGEKHHTLVPPTYREGSGPRQFESGKAGLPAKVTHAAVIEACQLIALSSAMKKIWPKESGVRHQVSLALGGALARTGFDKDTIQKVVFLIANAAGDEEAKSRGKSAADSHNAYVEGKHAYGWPELANLCGEAVYQIRDWFVDGKVELPNTNFEDCLISSKDLYSKKLPPQQYVVDQIMPTGAVIVLVGQPKAFKSLFNLELADSVANGEDFLAYKVPKSRRVLLVDAENGEEMLQQRLQALGLNVGKSFQILSNTALREKGAPRLNLADANCRDQLLKVADDFDLIIFDNQSMLAWGFDENDNSDPVLEQILMFLDDLRLMGKTVVYIVHTGHGGNRPRGNSRLRGFCDYEILLSRNEDDLSVLVTLNRGQDPKPSAFRVKWKLLEDDMLLPIMQYGTALSKDDLILEYIANNEVGLQKEIAEALNTSDSNVTKILNKLAAKGLITKKPVKITEAGTKKIQEMFIEEADAN